MARIRRDFVPAVVLASALLTLSAATGVAHAKGRIVGAFDVRVLLPPSYGEDLRRWPVVYLVPGSGVNADEATELLDLTTYVATDRAIVVVAAERDQGPNYVTDYPDGSRRLDTSFVAEVLPWVDRHYSTSPDRTHRAIAGFSAGGYSAAAVASRHPDRFSVVGTFSGVVDIAGASPAWRELVAATVTAGGGTSGDRVWGDPIADGDNFRAQNPVDLAGRLRDMRYVFQSVGSGAPADAAEVYEAGPGVPVAGVAEALYRRMNDKFDAALTAAGVAHVYRRHAGVHSLSNWREDLRQFWPAACQALAQPEPGALAVRVHPAYVHPGRLRRFTFVVSSAGRGVRGALVSFAGRTVSTGDDGRASARLRSSRPGPIAVRAGAAGAASATTRILVR